MILNDALLRFFESLPVPLLLIKAESDSLNHKITYLNSRFLADIGWQLKEIPDKNAWWSKAYPEQSYQKVVERQWELAVETLQDDESSFVSLDVNVQTKYHGVQRYRVVSEVTSTLVESHYIVTFEAIQAQRY